MISIQIAPIPVCLTKRQGIWLRYLVVQWRLPWNHPCSNLSLIMPASNKLPFLLLAAVRGDQDVSACSYCPQNILSNCCIGFNHDCIRSYLMAMSWYHYSGTNIPFHLQMMILCSNKQKTFKLYFIYICICQECHLSFQHDTILNIWVLIYFTFLPLSHMLPWTSGIFHIRSLSVKLLVAITSNKDFKVCTCAGHRQIIL